MNWSNVLLNRRAKQIFSVPPFIIVVVMRRDLSTLQIRLKVEVCIEVNVMIVHFLKFDVSQCNVRHLHVIMITLCDMKCIFLHVLLMLFAVKTRTFMRWRIAGQMLLLLLMFIISKDHFLGDTSSSFTNELRRMLKIMTVVVVIVLLLFWIIPAVF